MKRMIKQVAVMGSGTMGSGIAAQLANAGIRSFLLDIVPNELLETEKSRGLTLESPEVRNRIAANNKQQFILKSLPPLLMDKEDADLISVGNMEDNLNWLSQCDWIVEVVPENIEVKKQVIKKIQPYVKPGTIVTTNTSGISVNKIVEDMPMEFRQYWLGTHFFNPVRYMKLLEIIPAQETLPEIVEFMSEFGETTLGKSIVFCKDTPNFIANRIGTSTGGSIGKLMAELDLSVSEVDAITGTAIGRPGTGSFALLDLVGVDIGAHSTLTVYNNVSDPEEKVRFEVAGYIKEMLNRKMLGNKTKGGFYKKQGKEKLMLDIKTLEYVPFKAAEFDSLNATRGQKTLAGKLGVLFEGNDAAARLAWGHLKDFFQYSASKIPEISDSILNIDRAMRWGYNHSAGPFEMWNGLDLGKYVARMETEGDVVPAWVKKMLALGINSFYKTENGVDYYYSVQEERYLPIQISPRVISYRDLNSKNKAVKKYPAGTLYDLGDGVLGFEIATPNSSLTPELMDALRDAQEELIRNWDGMLVANSGKNFCVGANLKGIMQAIDAQQWSGIDEAVKYTQDVQMGLKYSMKPVVMVPYAMTLGGGCEMTMQGSAIQAAGELYMGLVEVGVGLIPGGGGCKEMTMRALERTKGTNAFPVEFIIPYLQNIATAKVSGSAKDAMRLGYLRSTDGISLNNDLLIADAKKKVLEMVDKNYAPPVSRPFPAPGRNDTALAALGARTMREAGYISEHDRYIFDSLVYIMSGGNITKGAMINEQYLLDLEREVFVDLCKTAKTQERIAYMLAKGKPLRN